MTNHAKFLPFALTVAAVILPAALQAQPAQSHIASAAGAVYIATNGVNQNQLIAYHRAADGTLNYIGSYPTGGRGSGGTIDPLQSQHSLLLSEDHRFLYAVNSGSGDVSVLSVGSEGRLSVIDRAPSGGGFPVSLAINGDLLYVLNSGGAGSVSGFHVLSNGHLQPIPGSTQLLSGASAGGASIDFSPDGKVLAAAERLTNRIDTFPIGSNGAAGTLVANASSGKTPFSLTFTPQGALLVSEAAGNPNGGSALSSYAVQPNTTLSSVTSSVPTGFAAACWIVASSDGHYAYAANAGSSQISIASVGDTGVLTILGSVGTGTGSAPLDIELSSNNRYLYALTAGTGRINGFRVEANGGLTALSSLPSLPAGSGQNGLAVY
ncbi:MAG: beta-propeller fold lactonase family protein [Capsulimonas sp.]|uniref:lactonase family protein n=1 Tax=Capsulimonas sp. TaxID=2494211 RepID=UPI0032652A56